MLDLMLEGLWIWGQAADLKAHQKSPLDETLMMEIRAYLSFTFATTINPSTDLPIKGPIKYLRP